jgi:F-type H+-transporting ATPase subunit gamma
VETEEMALSLGCQRVMFSGLVARQALGAAYVAPNPYTLVNDQQCRNMATLKEVKNRIKSVTSIQKITKSMKLVATTRLKKAEEMFDANKPSLLRLNDFLMEMNADAFEGEEAPAPEVTPETNQLVICMTTERGLCGSVNSSVTKVVKKMAQANAVKKDNINYILLGNKAAQALTRDCGENVLWSSKQMGGRSGPTFADILPVAEKFAEEEFDKCTFVKNKFVNLLVFETQELNLMSRAQMGDLEAFAYEYDSGVKEDTIDNFYSWYSAVALYSALAENHCIEIGQRMTSMDNATKNAGDLIKKLTMQYNRRRQANITTEITEIVSGAAALEDEE